MSLFSCTGNYSMMNGALGVESCNTMLAQTALQNCERIQQAWQAMGSTLPYPQRLCEGNTCDFRTTVWDLEFIRDKLIAEGIGKCSMNLRSNDTNSTFAEYEIYNNMHSFTLKGSGTESEGDSLYAETDFHTALKLRWNSFPDFIDLAFNIDPKNPRKGDFVFENHMGRIVGKCIHDNDKMLCQVVPAKKLGVKDWIVNYIMGTQQLEASIKQDLKAKNPTYKVDVALHQRLFTGVRSDVGSFTISLDPSGNLEVFGDMKTETGFVFSDVRPRRRDYFNCKVEKQRVLCNLSHTYRFNGAFYSQFEGSNATISVEGSHLAMSSDRKFQGKYLRWLGLKTPLIIQRSTIGVACNILHDRKEIDQLCTLTAANHDGENSKSASREFRLSTKLPKGTVTFEDIRKDVASGMTPKNVNDLPYLVRNANAIHQLGMMAIQFFKNLVRNPFA